MRTNSAVVIGLLGGVSIEMMLTQALQYNISLVRKNMISPQMNNVVHIPLPLVKLVTTAGDDHIHGNSFFYSGEYTHYTSYFGD